MNNDKFLVNLVSQLSHEQIFGLVWLSIGAFFVFLLWAYYKKTTRRNFRDGQGPMIYANAKRLGTTDKAKEVVVRENKPPVK